MNLKQMNLKQLSRPQLEFDLAADKCSSFSINAYGLSPTALDFIYQLAVAGDLIVGGPDEPLDIVTSEATMKRVKKYDRGCNGVAVASSEEFAALLADGIEAWQKLNAKNIGES